MASLKQAKNEAEIKAMTVSQTKKAYSELAENYTKILEQDLILCPTCGEFVTRNNFYSSNDYAIGIYPECKKCLLAEVEQRKKRADKPKETKESVQKVLRKMNLPYIDELYSSICKTVNDAINEHNKKSPFIAYMPPIKSLPQYIGKTWEDSIFEDDEDTIEDTIKLNQKIIKNGKKRFGSGFSDEDYMFLETEYKDWTSRYECNTKAQEQAFERLSFKKWEINNATKKGEPTKDLDKTYQEWLGTANIQPKQTGMDALADAQTFGTLIQKYEETRPLPEIDPELQDVDKIGLYIDVFFKGHASKMLGLKNNFTHIYEKFIKKFTVTRPEYNEETDSEDIFEKIFGSSNIE